MHALRPMTTTRQELLEQALFRGDGLHLENPDYLDVVRSLLETLLRSDVASKDLTASALNLDDSRASAVIVTREPGVVAGLQELCWLLDRSNISVKSAKNDGDPMESGDALLHLQGKRGQLLALERVALNLLQRMSGIATATRCFERRVAQQNPSTRVVATRKTLWGLLDKRAVHLGGGGTHRLSLADAILIKNNHLALIAPLEEEAATAAIERAWRFRNEAAFIEVEVRSEAAALSSARAFRKLREASQQPYPFLLMLDNMRPTAIATVLDTLRAQQLWDHVLIEASGGISDSNLQAYAATGVDAISVGSLTHSTRALDLFQRIQ